MHVHAYMHAYIHTYIHACIHTYTHACIHTCIHTSHLATHEPAGAHITLRVCVCVCVCLGAWPHEPAGARTCAHITVGDPRVTLPLSGRGSSGLCPLRSLFSFLFLFPSLSVCARIAWPASSSLPSREGTGERERERKMGNEREERERELFPSGGGGMVPEDLCVFQLWFRSLFCV